MDSTTEFEIKLEISAADVEQLQTSALLAHLVPKKIKQRLVTVYFDTPDRILARHQMSLRIRRSAHRAVQTVKSVHGSPLERYEWEAPIKGDAPELNRLGATPLAHLLHGKPHKIIQPVFKMQIERTLYPMSLAGTDLELTMDEGILHAEGRSLPLCEIEIELKHGGKTPVFDVARRIIHETSARLTLQSKAARGYALADASKPCAPAAFNVLNTLDGSLPIATAIRMLGYACLEPILCNSSGVAACQPQAIHQIRVAIRRLRSFMWFFRKLIAGPQSRHIRTELKWVMAELAAAREYHVVQQAIAAHVPHRPDDNALSDCLASAAETANDQAAIAVQSERFRLLALDIAMWLELGDWREGRDASICRKMTKPVRAYALAQLARLWTKIRRRGQHIGQLDQNQCHALRIMVKKMHYGLEFFAGFHTGKNAARQVEARLAQIRKLQDALGALNDMASMKHVLAALPVPAARAKAPQATEDSAYARMMPRGADKRLYLKAAKRAYARLIDAS
jgi:triphosphatase